jgi:putative transposase
VVQRGARRLQTFFDAGDYRRYLLGLRGEAERWDLSVWAYCLMPNHVHLVVVPSRPDGLSAPVGEAHRRYAWLINRREGWNGHLWQERFSSFPMDAEHLCLAVRYVLLNPVRAGLVREAWDWPYSSVAAHLGQGRDPLVDPAPLAKRIEDWTGYLRPGLLPAAEILRRHARSGLPLGSESFVAGLERLLDRPLRPLPRGRPPGAAKR